MTHEAPTIGLAIPAYRNPARLQACLRSVNDVAPSLLSRATIVDDSGDARVTQALSPEFPGVHWIAHQDNLGFGRSATEAVLGCPAEIVVLLNDDVILQTDPGPGLLNLFGNPELFAVTFQSFDESGRFREGAKRLTWSLGFPKILHNPRDQRAPEAGVRLSSYAVGGHCAYRKSCFRELGGFDPLFDPFYWEDVDLATRAAKRGWRTVFSPEIQVLHAVAGAIRSANPQERIRGLTFRNRVLFALRHCPESCRQALAVSLALQSLRARLTGDAVICEAIHHARLRYRDSVDRIQGDVHDR